MEPHWYGHNIGPSKENTNDTAYYEFRIRQTSFNEPSVFVLITISQIYVSDLIGMPFILIYSKN